MKKIMTKLIGFFFLLLSLNINSQDVSISNVLYHGTSTPNCGTINLGSESTYIITFDVRITRPYHDVYGNINALDESGVLKILYTTYYGTFEAAPPININVNSNWAIENNSLFVLEGPATATLYSYKISESGGILYAEYDTPNDYNNPYGSCNYSFTVPKFKLSPTNASVSCGSTGETFTVSNENNSPGSLSYQWSVGSGWSYNGNPVSNFTTSTNSVTLVPTTYPLSDVHVVPKLDGVSYPQLTSTVSLGSYNPNVSISGVSQICSTGVLFVNNLPVGSTVTSWHSPDTSIATISSINNHQGLIAKVNDGIVYISAKVENSCGQQKTIYKSVTVGSPNNLDTIDQFFLIEGMNDVVVETVDGIYDLEWKVNGVLVNDNGNDWVHIYFSNYPCVNNQVVLSARVDGICGWSNWLDMTYGECGFGGGMFRFSSNPISKEKGNGQIIIMEKKSVKDTKGYTIDIYNNFGEKVYSKTQRSMQFDISSLKKGLYIVKYQTKVGGISTKKLLVN